jgi:hypothetical protein
VTDAKKYFDQSLSDTSNMPGCRSGEETEELPDMFDWRKDHPECEVPAVD